jgi:hypothetical protein
VALVVPLAACTVLVGWGWGYYDLGARIGRWFLPPLAEVHGRVFLDDRPLKGAEVFTQVVGRSCRGAMGVSDADGRFALRTDIDGDFVAGAYAGEHRVTVQAMDPNAPSGPFKPPLITPYEYSDFETTPLRIHVHRDADRNQVEFRMERKPSSKPGAAGPQ